MVKQQRAFANKKGISSDDFFGRDDNGESESNGPFQSGGEGGAGGFGRGAYW